MDESWYLHVKIEKLKVRVSKKRLVLQPTDNIIKLRYDKSKLLTILKPHSSGFSVSRHIRELNKRGIRMIMESKNKYLIGKIGEDIIADNYWLLHKFFPGMHILYFTHEFNITVRELSRSNLPQWLHWGAPLSTHCWLKKYRPDLYTPDLHIKVLHGYSTVSEIYEKLDSLLTDGDREILAEFPGGNPPFDFVGFKIANEKMLEKALIDVKTVRGGSVTLGGKKQRSLALRAFELGFNIYIIKITLCPWPILG